MDIDENITSHDAILDVLAEDGDGRLINIEIQRLDTVDHARRTRFYAFMIDSVLYVNAAVDDGSDTAKLMEY